MTRARSDATYRGAWRGGARAANSRIKLLSEPIDRNTENYVRIVDTAAAEDATHALLVVHGYNNSFLEATQAVARIAGGADYKGRVYMFSWPSVSASLRYLQDVDNAEEAEGSLQAFLAAILRDNNIHTLDIVAHSMGSQQLIRVMGSIRSILDGRRQDEGSLHLGQVVFAAPDVSAAVFNTKILTWAKLAQRVTIYTSGGDWVLWLSSLLRGLNDRAGGHTPWGEPLEVGANNVYVVDKTPPEYDYWKFFKYTHADYVDDKVILNDIQTVITGKPAGDPSKRDPDGKVFKAMPYRGDSKKTYWETLPEGPVAEVKEAAKDARDAVKNAVKPRNRQTRAAFASRSADRAAAATPSGKRKHRHNALDAAAAVDLEGDAGDERRCRIGEEHRRVGDVVRARQPAQRNAGEELGAVLRRVGGAHELLQHAGLAHHRIDGVDADVLRRQFHRHRLRQRDHRALRAVVPGKTGARADAGGRGNVDDDAAAALFHLRHRRDGRQVDRLDVHRVDAVELGFAHLEQRLVTMRDACIVDDDVDAAERFGRRAHHGVDVELLGHVALHGMHLVAEAGGDLAHALSVDVGQR